MHSGICEAVEAALLFCDQIREAVCWDQTHFGSAEADYPNANNFWGSAGTSGTRAASVFLFSSCFAEPLFSIEQTKRSRIRASRHPPFNTLNTTNCCTRAVNACGKAGRQREALTLLGRMGEAGLRADTVVYNAAIDACSVAADWEAALQLLQEMKDGAAAAAEAPGGPGRGPERSTSGAPPPPLPPVPDVVSYASAITACARARRVEEALGLLSELRVNEAQEAAAVVRGGVTKGDGGRRKAGAPVPNLVTYSAGLFACLKVGDVPRGAELLDEMMAAGLQPNRIHCDTMVAA